MIKNIIIICLVGSLIYSMMLCNHFRVINTDHKDALEAKDSAMTVVAEKFWALSEGKLIPEK